VQGGRHLAAKGKNHGNYVSALTKDLESFVDKGLITEDKKEAIIKEMASSDCGR
jgi:hypothetical protein